MSDEERVSRLMAQCDQLPVGKGIKLSGHIWNGDAIKTAILLLEIMVKNQSESNNE